MQAMAWPATDKTHPALIAVTATLVPTATADLPAILSVARTPSDTRSTTHTVPCADASTDTTVRLTPEASNATGAAETIATGSSDSALASEASAARASGKAPPAASTSAKVTQMWPRGLEF